MYIVRACEVSKFKASPPFFVRLPFWNRDVLWSLIGLIMLRAVLVA
jgi:hypothetical protein